MAKKPKGKRPAKRAQQGELRDEQVDKAAGGAGGFEINSFSWGSGGSSSPPPSSGGSTPSK
jgi:hypothetical protein